MRKTKNATKKAAGNSVSKKSTSSASSKVGQDKNTSTSATKKTGKQNAANKKQAGPQLTNPVMPQKPNPGRKVAPSLPITGPAPKKGRANDLNTEKQTKPKEFKEIQKLVFDHANENISDHELQSAVDTIAERTTENGTSNKVRTELYTLLKAWGYTTPE